MWVHYLLLAAGLSIAWFPYETYPESGILLAAAILVLMPWSIDHSKRIPTTRNLTTITALLILVTLRLLDSSDISNGISELALAAAILTLMAVASRTPPPPRTIRFFVIGLAGLSLLAIWQVTIGFEYLSSLPQTLPDNLQSAAQSRLESGRAFASLLLPGHYAAMMATILPLLLAHLIKNSRSLLNLVAFALCITGLLLSRSPLGIFLAITASAVFLVNHLRPQALKFVFGTIPCAIALIMTLDRIFPSVLSIQAIKLRLDNWHTALWLWTTSPVSGVGLGSYGQTSQSVPFDVGNRPQHAHSLPLELLAELGPLGLLLIGVALYFLLRLVADLWPNKPALAIAITIIPLHNLADFSLYTSGVAIPWALLVGWAFALRKVDSHGNGEAFPVENPGLPLRLLAIGSAGTVLALVVLSATSVHLQRFAETEVHSRTSFDAAATSLHLAPWRSQPLAAVAAAALRSKDEEMIDEAMIMLEKGRRLRPQSGLFALYRSRLALAKGHIPTTACESWSAQHNQPTNTEFEGHFLYIFGQLDAVD